MSVASLTRGKVRLSVLRKIGWQLWDPIGLSGNTTGCEDEYDGYLLQVVTLLTQGRPRNEAVAYLIAAARDGMSGPPYEAEARRTVDAVADYLADLRTGSDPAH